MVWAEAPNVFEYGLSWEREAEAFDHISIWSGGGTYAQLARTLRMEAPSRLECIWIRFGALLERILIRFGG